MHIHITKGLLIIFWITFAANVVLPLGETIGSTVHWIGVVLIVVHALEYIVVRNKLNAMDAGGTHGLIQTLLFGFGYWLPLLQSAKTEPSS